MFRISWFVAKLFVAPPVIQIGHLKIFWSQRKLTRSQAATSARVSVMKRCFAGMLASALTLMHLGAFFLWLWLLARSGTLPASAQQQLQNFKKFSIKYDFDVDVSKRGPSVGAQLGALGPAKRNRSSQRLETMEP
jgi:hypothetical protein